MSIADRIELKLLSIELWVLLAGTTVTACFLSHQQRGVCVAQFCQMEIIFVGCLTGTSVRFIAVSISDNLKRIFLVIYVTTLYLRCAHIMISERKIIQRVKGGGRVLMCDKSVMVALTLAT
jgi:hypothetical protein